MSASWMECCSSLDCSSPVPSGVVVLAREKTAEGEFRAVCLTFVLFLWLRRGLWVRDTVGRDCEPEVWRGEKLTAECEIWSTRSTELRERRGLEIRGAQISLFQELRLRECSWVQRFADSSGRANAASRLLIQSYHSGPEDHLSAFFFGSWRFSCCPWPILALSMPGDVLRPGQAFHLHEYPLDCHVGCR